MNERTTEGLEALLPAKQQTGVASVKSNRPNGEGMQPSSAPLVEQGAESVVATPEPGNAEPESPTAIPGDKKQKRVKPLNAIQATMVVVRTIGLALLQATWWMVRLTLGYLRHHPLHAAFNMLLAALLGLVVVTGSRIYDDVILNRISESTIDKLIDASIYTRNYRSQDIRQRGTEEFLRVGAPEWTQREAIKAVLYHARRSGLTPFHQAALLATVEIESGFNPQARAPTTTACGLFQFVRKTGVVYGLKPTECMNPWLNAQAGVAHYIDNYNARVHKRVEALSGGEKLFRTFELTYYLHHDGPLSSNPQNDVKAVVLTATPFLFRAYKVLLEEYEMKKQAPTFADTFAGEFWKVMSKVGYELSATVKRFYTKSTFDVSGMPDEVAPLPIIKPEDPEVTEDQQEALQSSQSATNGKGKSRAVVKVK